MGTEVEDTLTESESHNFHMSVFQVFNAGSIFGLFFFYEGILGFAS